MAGYPMKSLQGQLLIASPKLFDPNFFRSVILLVQHGENGALGLVLNRPLEMTIANAWEQVSEMPCEATGFLHQGGPCDGPLMVLHTDASIPEMPVIPEVRSSSGASATLTTLELPLNESAPPYWPAVDQVAPVIVPVFALPDASAAVAPLPSSNE